MRRVFDKLMILLSLLKSGDFKATWQHLKLWFYSDESSYGLMRDITVPFTARQARIPISVHTLTESEAKKVFSTSDGDSHDLFTLKSEHDFYKAGVKTCYVAVTEDGDPTYIQWLIGPDENAAVQHYFKGLFPYLQPGQALLEYAFTLPEYRSKGIMPYAMAQIAEHGQDIGATQILTFVDVDNIPALKGCQRAGFSPYMLRTEKWRFFRRMVDFTLLPPNTPYPYEQDMPKLVTEPA